MAFSIDGRRLVSSADDETIRLWDTATGALQETLETYLDWIDSVTFSPDGRYIASGSDDSTVRLWDAATGALQRTFEGHSKSVQSVIFSPDSQILASGSYDSTVRVWDAIIEDLRQTLSVEGVVTTMEISKDGLYLSTNLGSLSIRACCDDDTSNLSLRNMEIIVWKNRWIIIRGEKALLLPPEYQPNCSAVNQGIVALGLASERIYFCAFPRTVLYN